MKTLSFLAALLISVSACEIDAHSQSDTQSVTEIIIAAEQAWAKAAVDHDVDTFAKYMSNDYVLIEVNTTPDKVSRFDVTDKSTWVELVRSRHEKYDAVEIHNLKVRLNGDVATVTGEYSQKGTRDGKDISAVGLYVDTWTKRKGQWELVSSVFP
jgi:ketosteroid isomerase-like protein